MEFLILQIQILLVFLEWLRRMVKVIQETHIDDNLSKLSS